LRLFLATLFGAAFSAISLAAIAADPATMMGAVKSPLTLDDATLSAMPVASISISYGSSNTTYTGVLVWELLKKAELVAGDGKNASLRHTLLVTAANGYSVAVALGELDPDYGNKQVLLAYHSTDGSASFDHLRLLVPGDVHGGRAVRDVAKIEVN
jgi:hypothetical protein